MIAVFDHITDHTCREEGMPTGLPTDEEHDSHASCPSNDALHNDDGARQEQQQHDPGGGRDQNARAFPKTHHRASPRRALAFPDAGDVLEPPAVARPRQPLGGAGAASPPHALEPSMQEATSGWSGGASARHAALLPDGSIGPAPAAAPAAAVAPPPPSGNSDGARAAAARAALDGVGDKAWLLLLTTTQGFFKPCTHGSHASSADTTATFFDRDCPTNGPLCASHAREATLRGHSVLQVRRSTYHEVLKLSDVTPLLDTTGIQPYVINNARVLFLRPRPQPRAPKGGAAMPATCRLDGRQLMDPSSRYCSIRCKLQGEDPVFDAAVAALKAPEPYVPRPTSVRAGPTAHPGSAPLRAASKPKPSAAPAFEAAAAAAAAGDPAAPAGGEAHARRPAKRMRPQRAATGADGAGALATLVPAPSTQGGAPPAARAPHHLQAWSAPVGAVTPPLSACPSSGAALAPLLGRPPAAQGGPLLPLFLPAGRLQPWPEGAEGEGRWGGPGAAEGEEEEEATGDASDTGSQLGRAVDADAIGGARPRKRRAADAAADAPAATPPALALATAPALDLLRLPAGMSPEVVSEVNVGANAACARDGGVGEGSLSRHGVPHLPPDRVPPRKRTPLSPSPLASVHHPDGGALSDGDDSAHSTRSGSSWRRKSAAPLRSPLQ